MRAILFLATKDLRLLWRDRMGMFWVFGFPLLMVLLFGSLYSGGGAQNIDVAVADDDGSARAKEFIHKLHQTKALSVQTMSLKDATEKVRSGKVDAFVHVLPGFGKVKLGGGQSIPLEMGADPSKSAATSMLQGILVQKWFESIQDIFTKPGSMKKLVKSSLDNLAVSGTGDAQQDMVLKTFLGNTMDFLDKVDTKTYGSSGPLAKMQIKTVSVLQERAQPRSSFDITFPSGILWALIACATAFAISLVSERTSGTLTRIMLSPLRFWQILAGKGLACFIACVSTSAVLLFIGVTLLKVQLPDPIKASVAVVAVSLGFVGIMMFISVLGKTERSVSGAGWAILLVMAMFGGCMMPLAFMPSWMQSISSLSPVKWGILALEGAVWRDFTYQQMLPSILVLLGVGIVSFVLGTWILSRTKL